MNPRQHVNQVCITFSWFISIKSIIRYLNRLFSGIAVKCLSLIYSTTTVLVNIKIKIIGTWYWNKHLTNNCKLVTEMIFKLVTSILFIGKLGFYPNNLLYCTLYIRKEEFQLSVMSVKEESEISDAWEWDDDASFMR